MSINGIGRSRNAVNAEVYCVVACELIYFLHGVMDQVVAETRDLFVTVPPRLFDETGSEELWIASYRCDLEPNFDNLIIIENLILIIIIVADQ